MKDCPHRVAPELPRRPVNGLCVEVGQPATRCKLQPPSEWKDCEPKTGASMATRWLWSGGSPLVFAPCNCDDPDRCSLVRG